MGTVVIWYRCGIGSFNWSIFASPLTFSAPGATILWRATVWTVDWSAMSDNRSGIPNPMFFFFRKSIFEREACILTILIISYYISDQGCRISPMCLCVCLSVFMFTGPILCSMTVVQSYLVNHWAALWRTMHAKSIQTDRHTQTQSRGT